MWYNKVYISKDRYNYKFKGEFVMEIRECDKPRLINKVIEYAEQQQRKNKIMRAVGLATMAIGSTGLNLATFTSIPISPKIQMLCASLALAGIGFGIYATDKVIKTDKAIARMQRDKQEIDMNAENNSEISMYR